MSVKSEKSESALNLFQKLAKIRKTVEVLQKNRDGYNFKYVAEDVILSKITGGMDRLGVSLVPGVVPGTLHVVPYSYEKVKWDRNLKQNVQETVNDIIVTADTTYTWVNNDRPEETIVVPWGLVGQQSDASQSFGSGLSYTFRYFLLKYFDVATVEDDPDNWRSKQLAAEEAEKRAICKQILARLDESVRAFLAQNKDKSADVKRFVSQYVKDGAYMEIKEPGLASRVLDAFLEQYVKNDDKEKQ